MSKKKILVLGHSIVRRFKQFLAIESQKYNVDMGLSKTHSITFRGVGGRKVTDILKFDSRVVRRCKPDGIILMVGGNDVKQADSPEELAAIIESVVSVLHYRFHVPMIYVCKLLPRFHQSYDYNETADRVNELLSDSLSSKRFASFWNHNGMFPSPDTSTCDHKFRADGIHPNTKGNVHLYRSLRGLMISKL